MMFCVHLTLNEILFLFLNFKNKIIPLLNSFSKVRVRTMFMNGRPFHNSNNPMFTPQWQLQMMCGIVVSVIPPSLSKINYFLVILFLFLQIIGFICSNKSHRLPFGSSSISCSTPFEIIYIDVWGPALITSFDKFRFYIIFIDYFTKYTWIYPFRHK